MKNKGNIHYTDVENASALRKLRVLMKMDTASFAKFLGTTEDALDVMENLDSKVPSHFLLKATGQVGIVSSDMIGNGRLDKLLDEAGFDYKALMPDHIRTSEIFDLINLYGLVLKKNERLNVLSILKMLACDRSGSKSQPKTGRT